MKRGEVEIPEENLPLPSRVAATFLPLALLLLSPFDRHGSHGLYGDWEWMETR